MIKQVGFELVSPCAVRLIDRALVCAGKDAVVKVFNASLGLIVILLSAVASDCALAARGHSGRSASAGHAGSGARSGHHGHRARIGVFLGAPLFSPFYSPFFYPSSGYYYTPALPAASPVYIEQETAPPRSVLQPSYWYYCADSKTYYPYVDDCPGGWQQVVPEALPPS